MLNWKDYVKMRIDYLTLFSEGSPRKCWQDQAPATPRVYHLHKATFPGFPSFPTSLFQSLISASKDCFPHKLHAQRLRQAAFEQQKLQASQRTLRLLLALPPTPKITARCFLLQRLGHSGSPRDNNFLLPFCSLHPYLYIHNSLRQNNNTYNNCNLFCSVSTKAPSKTILSWA